MAESPPSIPQPESNPEITTAQNEIKAFLTGEKPGTTKFMAAYDAYNIRAKEADYFHAVNELSETDEHDVEAQTEKKEEIELKRLQYALSMELQTKREGEIPGYFTQAGKFDILCMKLGRVSDSNRLLNFLNDQLTELMEKE